MPELIWDKGGKLVPQVAEAGTAADVVEPVAVPVLVPVAEAETAEEPVEEEILLAASVADVAVEEVVWRFR